MAITLFTAPARDWLPSGKPITYVFASDAPQPKALFVRIEVSSNGSDFVSPITAGVLNFAPDTSGRYTVNVAGYLNAMFEPGSPFFTGQDFALFRLYRLVVGETPGFTGYSGTPELTTTGARCIYATEQTENVDGFYTLTKYPGFVLNSDFAGVETKVTISTNQLTTRPVSVATVPAMPCFPYPMQLYWLNAAGGWQTWVFGQKHEYSEEISEPLTWQDESYRTHVASFAPTLQRVNVFSGPIPLAAFDTVFTILRAIRVYHLDNGVFREVRIDAGSYQRHKESQRRKELNFSFAYAEPLLTQTA